MKLNRKLKLFVIIELCFFLVPFYMFLMPFSRAQTEPYALHLTFILGDQTNSSLCVTYFTDNVIPTNAKWGLSSSNLDNSAIGTTTY
jgi:hypothetical protein